MLIGSNGDEGTMFTPPRQLTATFNDQAERQYGKEAEAFLKLYPATTD